MYIHSVLKILSTERIQMPSAHQIAKKQKIKERLEELLLRGETNQSRIAAAFGVTQPTISRYIKEIVADWKKFGSETSQENRAKRIKQLELIASNAWRSFEISQQSKIETEIKTKKCPDCVEGKTRNEFEEEETCESCQGTGMITVETQTQEGKPGDATFLRTVKEVLVELSKLEGLYPTSGGKLAKLTEESIEGAVDKRVQRLTYEGPVEDIIMAKAAMDKLKQNINDGTAKIIEGELVEIPNEAEEGQDD